MGRAYSTYWGENRCTQGFCGETRGKETAWKTQAWMRDNIKIYLRKVGWEGMDWVELTEDRYRWRAVVNAVMNLWVP